MCIQMPFWINTSSYFIQDWWFKTLYSKERVNVPDPIQVSNTSHHRHPISQKGKYVSNCHKSSLEGYVQLWFPSQTNPPNLLFPVPSGMSWWPATVQFGVGPVAWRLSQCYVFQKNWLWSGCFALDEPANWRLGQWQMKDWLKNPRMEIWRWPVATVKVGKIRPGPDHSLFTIQTKTNNKQILSRNSDKNTDTEQNKQQTTK